MHEIMMQIPAEKVSKGDLIIGGENFSTDIHILRLSALRAIGGQVPSRLFSLRFLPG